MPRKIILILVLSTMGYSADYVYYPQDDVRLHQRRLDDDILSSFSATAPIAYDGAGGFSLLYDTNDFDLVSDVLNVDFNNLYLGFFTSGSIIYADTDGTLTESNPGLTWLNSTLSITGDVQQIGDVNQTGDTVLTGEFFVDGNSILGDGGVQNYVDVENDGDILFFGGAGLATAEIYSLDNSTETVISGSGEANKVQYTEFSVNGVSNNATPDHTNDHITIITPAIYHITASITSETVAGIAAEFSFDVYKNNGATALPNLHSHRSFSSGAGTTGSISLSGKAALSANDTVELWIHNEDNTRNIIITDATFGLFQVAGIGALPGVDFILKEDGDAILQEDGTSKLFIEPTT